MLSVDRRRRLARGFRTVYELLVALSISVGLGLFVSLLWRSWPPL